MKHSNNDLRIKPTKKDAKPRSDLQIATSQATWVTNFRLHRLPFRYLNALISNPELITAVIDYNKAVFKLKYCVKQSLAMTKMHILRKRKLNIDNKK